MWIIKEPGGRLKELIAIPGAFWVPTLNLEALELGGSVLHFSIAHHYCQYFRASQLPEAVLEVFWLGSDRRYNLIFALEVFLIYKITASWKDVSATFLSAWCQPYAMNAPLPHVYANEILGVCSDKDIKSIQLFLKKRRRRSPHRNTNFVVIQNS